MSFRLRLTILLALLCLLLAACSPATKYVLVTDRSEVNFADGDRFYLCLLADDAKRMSGMLKLRTRADVHKYELTRIDSSDPFERILFHLIRADYGAARAGLEQQGEMLPSYVRLLLKADLAYETSDMPTTGLVQLYQEAFEGQGCDLNRDLIKMRIRQVRYGR